jgi:hypothetical protein
MQGFRSWPGLQRFVSTFSALRNHFVPPRSHRFGISWRLAAPWEPSLSVTIRFGGRPCVRKSLVSNGRAAFVFRWTCTISSRT